MTATRPKTKLPPWFIWFLVISFVGAIVITYNYSVFRARMMTEARNIPPIKEVPSFALQERGGGTVRTADLIGEVWLANFIFTRCPTICPALTETMATYQERLAELDFLDVKLVSITVDPEFDTPQVLAEFAAKYGADTDRWLFLTGDRQQVLDLVVKGFMLPVVENHPDQVETDGQFIHSTRVALVDRRGMIRGYYDTTSPEAVEKLFGDIEFLREQYR